MYFIREPKNLDYIKTRYNSDIKDLLYHMHWSEDKMHKEIACELGVSRSTVTRWFKLLNVPSQSCRRFTDKNLSSWLYKTGELKKKTRYNGPDRRSQKIRKNVNIDFFKTWSEDMAYVLGFFSADGGMFINSQGSRYLQFTSTDHELLHKIKELLSAKQKISIKRKNSKNQKDCFLLQIGSKEIFDDLKSLGFTPNKELNMKLPPVPDKYFNHFLRGYFDGDGCISISYYKKKDRKCKSSMVSLTFASGSEIFLKEISKKLVKSLSIGKGYFYKNRNSVWLKYGKEEAKRICDFMYAHLATACFLERKHSKFIEIFN